METRALLIDASIYIFRAWFSLPDRWHTQDGWPLNAVYGYCSFLLDLIEATASTGYGAAAFDESLGSCFRNDILPTYKSSRDLPDEALAFQLKACRYLTECFGISCFGGPRYEADDYLASLAKVFHQHDIAVSVVTRDKDLTQILSVPGDRWWDFAGGVSLDSQAVRDKYGVGPEQFADYLALVGDRVDDVPGVPGVGAKTAVRLLQSFGDLDTLKAQLDSVAALQLRGAQRIQKSLREHWPQLVMARQLTGLEDNIDEVCGLPQYCLQQEHMSTVCSYLDELGLSGPLIRRCEKLARSLPA